MAIIQMPATREAWLEMRKKYIGASESVALLGIDAQQDYQMSPLALWLTKSGRIPWPEMENERADWGNAFEAAIATEVCRREKWELHPGVYAVDDSTPGMGASLDRVVLPSAADIAAGFTGPGALEVKNVDSKVFRDDWINDEPPPHILIQLQHQLACSTYLWGAVGACVGGNQYYVRRYMRHEGIIASIRAAVTEFWQSIKDGKAPAADRYESTAQALKLLYPTVSNRTVDLRGDNELPDLCARATALAKERQRILAEEEEIKNQVRAKIGDARFVLYAGGKISRSIGKDTPDRPAQPNEIIRGRKGQDRLTITPSKEAA